MKKSIVLLLLLPAMFIFMGSSSLPGRENPKILVFSKTTGFRHASIPEGKKAIMKLGKENGFDVDTTENAGWFTDKKLSGYAAVVFLNTTGDVLNDAEQVAFERYIQAGGGYVGVHAASDTEYSWPWYGKLVGAYFTSHPAVQMATFIIKNKKHPATSFFTDSLWIRKDELYNFKDINPRIKTLITIDETTYNGGKNGAFHPMSWYHKYDGGRVFYTAMGHTTESYTETNFLKHLLGGIQYAIGKNVRLNYKKAVSQYPVKN